MELLYFMIVSLGAVTASGDFKCLSPPTCKCSNIANSYFWYSCNSTNESSNVSIAVQPNEIAIDCSEGMDQSWADIINGVNATNNPFVHHATDVYKSLVIADCPVPENKSIAEILKNLAVKSIEQLEFKWLQSFNNVLTDRYLENLSFVHSLQIREDVAPFTKKILDGMPNLERLELPQHVMSTIRLYVLKIEAEKRSSNSTHNNTRTDLTIIEKLSEFSELNLMNTDVNILVERTWSPNLQSVNLTNNTITFLLFENLPNLTHISLTDNQIGSLQEGTFSNLIKLKQISIDHNEMSRIESGTFKDLRYLLNISLSGNNLTDLPSYLFKNCPNLTILDISRNKLTALNETSLHGLKRLKTLLLQDNQLTEIKGSIFQNLLSLEELNLQDNRLTYLELFIFNRPENNQIYFTTNDKDSLISIQSKCAVREINLKNNSFKGHFFSQIQLSPDNSLRSLDLSHNDIKELSVEVTLNRSKELPELTVILDCNNITSFEISNFETVSAKYDHSLNYTGGLNMSLVGNPFDCDDEKTLNFFRGYFRPNTNPTAIKMMNPEKMTCAKPENLKNIPVQFAQRQSNTLRVIGIICGILVFALLAGTGFRIHVHYINLAHRILKLLLVTQLDGSTKQNAILIHSHLDEEFIVRSLTFHLKNAFKSLETSLIARDLRDWNSEESADDQIANLARKSEIIIIILSPNFLKTIWAKQKFKTAILRNLKNCQDRTMIISLLDTVAYENLDTELRASLPPNKYYLHSKDEMFREKLEKTIRAAGKVFQEKLNRDSNFVDPKDLDIITNNTSVCIGRGGFGSVYKGCWRGSNVAVKYPGKVLAQLQQYNTKVDTERERERSRKELEFFQTCRHPNILLLLAWSLDDKGRAILIFRYMSKGSLRNVLFSESERQNVSWKERLDIAKGITAGLTYLHEKNIIHLDIKCENILLDEHLVPQIGDFGLTREGLWAFDSHLKGVPGSCLITTAQGTPEYLPDDYIRTGELSTKVDTYSFGMVLLEMSTGRIESRKNPFLRNYVRNCGQERLLIDSSGGGENLTIFDKLIEIGKKCVEDEAKDRPEMSEVSEKLDMIINMIDSISEDRYFYDNTESYFEGDSRQPTLRSRDTTSGECIRNLLRGNRETRIVQPEYLSKKAQAESFQFPTPLRCEEERMIRKNTNGSISEDRNSYDHTESYFEGDSRQPIQWSRDMTSGECIRNLLRGNRETSIVQPEYANKESPAEIFQYPTPLRCKEELTIRKV